MAVGKFAISPSELAAFITGSEAEHQLGGERPRLAAEIPDIGYTKGSLLKYFAGHALLKILTGLHKTGHKGVEVAAEGFGVHKKRLLPTNDEHHYSRVKLGKKFASTLRADSATFRVLFQYSAACAAEAHRLGEVVELRAFAGCGISLGREKAPRFAQAMPSYPFRETDIGIRRQHAVVASAGVKPEAILFLHIMREKIQLRNGRAF